jgi:energy-coupling factor transporter transmembrane protein EcfT
MPGLFIWIHDMHPSVRIVLLMLLAVTVQFLALQALVITGSALVAMAIYWHVGLLRKILYRSRWLMMTLLLVYAFATPGEHAASWAPGGHVDRACPASGHDTEAGLDGWHLSAPAAIAIAWRSGR